MPSHNIRQLALEKLRELDRLDAIRLTTTAPSTQAIPSQRAAPPPSAPTDLMRSAQEKLRRLDTGRPAPVTPTTQPQVVPQRQQADAAQFAASLDDPSLFRDLGGLLNKSFALRASAGNPELTSQILKTDFGARGIGQRAKEFISRVQRPGDVQLEMMLQGSAIAGAGGIYNPELTEQIRQAQPLTQLLSDFELGDPETGIMAVARETQRDFEKRPLAVQIGLGLLVPGPEDIVFGAVGKSLGAVSKIARRAPVPVAEDVISIVAPQLARRPTVEEAQAFIPGIRKPVIPPGAASVQPPGHAGTLFDFQPIQSGLSKSAEIKNIVRSTLAKVTRSSKSPIQEDPLISAAKAEQDRVALIIESQSNRISRSSDEQVNRIFVFDENGRIPELDNIHPGIKGAPTIQDVAARLPTYADALGPARVDVLRALEVDIGQVRAVYDDVGIEVSQRLDIEKGGFYLPRGDAEVPGGFDLPTAWKGRGAKPGHEIAAVFPSQAEGINRGWEYPSFATTLNQYVRQAGKRASTRHATDFLANATDEAGNLLGETAKQRAFRQNPTVVTDFLNIQKDIARLKALKVRMADRLASHVDDLINNPLIDDPDKLDDLIKALDIRVGPGGRRTSPNVGQNIREVNQAMVDIRREWFELRPTYKRALEKAQRPGPGQGAIDMPGLGGRGFPAEMANAAARMLESEGPLRGKGAGPLKFFTAAQDIYRAANATLDNSAPGIQGLIGMVLHPRSFAKAMKVNAKIWLTLPGRDTNKILGKFIVDFDNKALREGTLSSDMWIRNGLRLGAGQTEFEIGRGALSAIEKFPGVKRANRAFGFFGDSLRLDLAQNELGLQLSKGRSLDDIIASGDIKNISRTINRVTGWTPDKTFGSVGDLLFFAPRFLQSRLETLASAGLGLRPGATLDQRIARRSMLRLVGYGVLGTVLLNEARGKETDFRPIVNGRYNSNFIRVRDLFGRDWSLFGTWDGLARAIVTTGLGHPEDSLRGLGSGAVSMGWDMITGTSFNGERPREDLGSFGMWLLHSFTPFAMQELPEAISQIYGGSQQQDVGQVASGAGLVFGETFGAKSAPQSFLDEADSTSREIFQGQRYKDLEDYQKDDVQKAESVKRAAARRPSYGYFAALDAIEDRRLEGNSDILFLANEGALTPNEAVNKYFQVKTEARISRTQAAVDFNIEFDSNDSDAAETLIKGSGEEALAQYYQSLEDATKVEINGEIIETEIFNSRKWTEILDDLQSRWTPLQYAYVIRNTNRRELSKGILDLLEHHSKPEYERQNNAINAREQHREYIQRTGFYKTPFSAEYFTIGGAIEQIRSQP